MSAALQLHNPEPTAVAIIRGAVSTIVSADKGDILGKLAAELDGFQGDISTEKGRKEIASKAGKVATAKMDLIRLGKSLTEGWRASTKAVNEECKVIEDRMDALKRKVRAQLDEYEATEAARVKGHTDALAALQESSVFYAVEQPSADVRRRLDYLMNLPPRDWQEFKARASDAVAIEIDRTSALLVRMERREADIAEAARVEAERVEALRLAAIAAQEARERQIAQEAAANAKRQAEETAERERQETLRAAALERTRIEQAAQAERDQAEAERVASAKRERDLLEAAERAEARRIADATASQEREHRLAEAAEQARIEAHKFALSSIKGMVSDAVSPFNDSGMIRHITKVMDGMAEMRRDWQEFAGEAHALIADGRKRIAEHLALVLGQEDAWRIKVEQDQVAKAESDRLAAVEVERKRAADQKAAEDAVAARRAENKAIRARANREALTDLMKIDGMTETLGMAVIAAAARGQIRNVGVTY
jgi:colicin import membrane protein